MALPATIPSYRELFEREGQLPGSNWGLFGRDDQLGALNFIDDACTLRAAALVKRGRSFPLGLGQNYFDPPLVSGRKGARHEATVGTTGMDDRYDDFYPQASSQWDALKHNRHPKYGSYNGFSLEQQVADEDLLSISNMARKGIVTRGVLADVARWREAQGRPIDCSTDEVVPTTEIQATLKDAKVELRQGDVLCIRVGWLAWWQRMHSTPGWARPERLRFPGIANDPSMPELFWDNRIAAVASDAMAVEATPGPGGRSLHIQVMTYLGMPFGELWDFEALAEDCARDRVYEFMLCSAPLDLPGGCGSPAAAIAIK